jgi:hypothetical protein
VPKIKCPTLVITTEESALASVDVTRAWQQTIPNSELLVLPGNSYHVAVSDAERCAQATLEFISRRKLLWSGCGPRIRVFIENKTAGPCALVARTRR